MRRALPLVVACALVVGLAPGPAVAKKPSVAAAEREAKELANSERVSRGIPQLRWNAELRDIARRHAERMAREARLHHNRNLKREVPPHRRLGENVGVGTSMRLIHDAFMDSEGHRRNLLSPYTIAGFGAAVTDGEVWITQVFLTPK